VFIHVIITGGQALLETLEGFRALAAAAGLRTSSYRSKSTSARSNSDWQIMARQRIRTVQRDLFEQLDAVGF
jgi:hypothetical protein